MIFSKVWMKPVILWVLGALVGEHLSFWDIFYKQKAIVGWSSNLGKLLKYSCFDQTYLSI